MSLQDTDSTKEMFYTPVVCFIKNHMTSNNWLHFHHKLCDLILSVKIYYRIGNCNISIGRECDKVSQPTDHGTDILAT